MPAPYQLVIRVRASWEYALSRVTAVLIAAVAVLLVTELVTDGQVEAYDAVLVGTVVVGAIGTATWLWRVNGYEARLAAVVLAALVLVGQVLVSVVGVPGGPAAAWTPTGIAVAVLAVAILTLVTLDARRAWPSESVPPPYAL